MEYLKPPEFKLSEIYDKILMGITKKKEVDGTVYRLFDEYHKLLPCLLEAESDYYSFAEDNKLYLIEERSRMSQVIDSDDMKWLYTQKFLKTGRGFYDKLRARPKNSICPYCGKRDVYELDHYLSKSDYPQYAITPANLIPCCHICNHKKLSKKVHGISDLVLNPYFDDINTGQWLFCTFEVQYEALIPVYYFNFGELVDEQMQKKVCSHFEILELKTAYAEWAGRLIYIYLPSWKKIFYDCGKDSLLDELGMNEQSFSEKQGYINSYERAFYQGIRNYFLENNLHEIFEMLA